MKVSPLRFCTSCSHDVRDDGLGCLRNSGNSGGKRWQCGSCVKKQAARSGSSKKSPGRKPKQYYQETPESDSEIREFIQKVLGISSD